MTFRKSVVNYSLENKASKTWKEIVEHFNLEPTDKNIKMVNDWFRYYKNTGNYEPVTYTQEEEKEILQENSIIPEGFKIKSAWQTPNGEMRYSYVPLEEESNSLDLNFIKDSLLKEVKPIIEYKKVEGKTIVLFIGDAHIGMSIDSEAPLAKKTLSFNEILNNSLKLINEPFEEVVVVYGGDMTDSVNNYTTRGSHYSPSSLTDREMFEEFVSASKTFFTSLIENPLVGKLSFYSVAEDNHTGSMAGIFSRSLELWLNAKYPFVQTKVFSEFIDFFTLKGHTFILTHGKDKKEMFKQLPLFLDPKTESYIMSWCISKGILPNYRNTHVVKFDLHQSSYQLGKFFSYLNCLSANVPSKWAQHNFMSYNPGINYSIITENGIVNGEYFF